MNIPMLSSFSCCRITGDIRRPNSLYELSVNTISSKYKHLSPEFSTFPSDIYLDILYGLYLNERNLELYNELTKLQNFMKALKATSKRIQLHRCFQAITNFSFSSMSVKPSCVIVEEFVNGYCDEKLNEKSLDLLIGQGLSIAAFLSEAGWLEEDESILLFCKNVLLAYEDCDFNMLLECYQRLLHVQNGFCLFKSAEKTFLETKEFISQIEALGYRPNLACIYSEFSTLFMLRSNYAEAYEWSIKSLQELVPNMHESTLVDVYRQTAKSCVLKREFKKAGLLIREALKVARGIMKVRTLKYADALLDFGFYLLNVDAIGKGIEVYQLALHVRQSVFGIGSKNLHLATAHEDLSYASYVFNYSNGLFSDARTQAEKAITLLLCLLPKDHLLLSSCKRVKALILEEIAIENSDNEIEAKYLEEAHNLHNEALQLSLEAFGEMNVQTAKHYGNLGRLYQSMKKFEKAEEMHLKAISIKESLLGPNDYEVALSVGHLASLYNYDLEYYNKAEMLYLRSIEIGKKLFGETYSGLEYDYRGLLRVYTNLCDVDKRLQYIVILRSWKIMREQMDDPSQSPFCDLNEPFNVDYVIQTFMTL